MNKINVMDELLANKIAAGEVVERLSSVVKELTENSIDAGSKIIKIDLIECGFKEIKITDDGCGMSNTDAKMCFLRHATSKIKQENDLYFISTLGFRGEALAAISSVSYIQLDTYDLNESTHLIVNAGKIIKESIGNKRKGTTISVSKIFYNTPARLKFLKSMNSELSNIALLIERISLSHPDISFTLSNDNKELLKTSGSNNLYKTIHEIYGYNTSKNMINISAENYDYKISGYISNINISKSSKNSIITLVNNRVISNSSVNKCIKDAYHTVLAENRYPVCIINIDVDSALIDVNVHPTKQDIKFSKLDSLTELLYNTIKDKLNSSDNTYEGYLPNNIIENQNSYSPTYNISNLDIVDTPIVKEEKKNIESLRLDFSSDNITISNEKDNMFIKPVGLALGTYLVAQDEDIMYLIDIHAANERINFEKYLKALKEEKIYKTDMLYPITIELSFNEYNTLKNNISVLESIGFEFKEFGINTYRVVSHPSFLKKGYEEESIKLIIDILCSYDGKFDRVKFCEKTAINLSCKMSVKANTNISVYEQEVLINRLFKCDFPYVCPHGRPTIIKYPKYELEKIFKRAD